MGYRLSKIYTRGGDDGTTGLGDGSRVMKESARMEAIGTVDELNSLVGVLLAWGLSPNLEEILTGVQHRLFDLGGELALPGHEALTEADTTLLEQQLDELNAAIPPLQEFILPGGSRPAASCHNARSVCRRAERRLAQLTRQEDGTVRAEALKYINRLSDLLFVMARVLARQDGGREIYWDKNK